MNNDNLANVRKRLQEFEAKFRGSAQNWKLGYRSCLGASTFFSAAAAIVGKLEYFKPEAATDVAAILAGITAVIITLIAAFDFESNWRLNRRSRHEITALLLESEKSTADPDTLLSELQMIIHRRNEALNKQDA